MEYSEEWKRDGIQGWRDDHDQSEPPLYAQWSDAPIKEGTLDTIKETFDKFLDKTKEFMDEEMIDGVKNLYVVVGGAAVFLLIAVLAMRR